MAGSRPWPTPPARAGCRSEDGIDGTYPHSGGGGEHGGGGDGDRRRRGRGRENENRQERGDGDELKDKLVTINRVAKVVKGGRRFSFAALVVVGDQKGRVGWGAGKAREVPEAIRKATEQAKRTMIRVPMREGRTLHHDVLGEFGAGRVILRAAPAGTGIIAGGPMRAIFETLGMGDVVAKCTGSTNPHNMIKATFAALNRSTSPRAVASRRGKKVSDLLGPRKDQAPADAAAQEAASV
ncbi:30S ribosomal protein S5 [Paeniroseomonas aquatica]|uniref:30S ribosomal protein S5 n=1 Tax=Paeniroseomonas aquatica TaxID=373043 RepID=UPI003605CA11